jgi:hypothetical protein
MPLNVELIVTVITKLTPSLYEQAMKAFHGASMKPNRADAELLNEYLGTLKNRDVFDLRVRDNSMDPVIKSVDEVRQEAYRFIGLLHSYTRGQVMVEAILDGCKEFLRKWAAHQGKGYSVTYDGAPSGRKQDTPGGSRESVALFEAFAQDHLELRSSVNILREGIADIVKGGAPAWGGWVRDDVGKAIVGEVVKSL